MISDEEMAVLAEVQRLPLVASPFAEISLRLNMEEKKVLEICENMLSKGMIRRFGISLNHRLVGIRENLMVVVNVPLDRIDEVGQAIAKEKGVTHCYYRTGWDYNLFFMIHSESKEEVINKATEITKKMELNDYKYMFSTREFKKTSFEVPKPTEEDILNDTYQIPLVLNLSGPIIIFGGGDVGKRKFDFISKFTKVITVISKESLELPDYVRLHIVDLKIIDIPKFIPDDSALVIAALSDSNLNEAISNYCIKHNILINIVDNPKNSTVHFPALSKFGDLNVAISTGGKCPFLSRKIREYWDSIGSDWADWIEILSPIRERLIGIHEKNLVISKIYNNPEISEFVKAQDLNKAKKKAEEIYNTYRKS